MKKLATILTALILTTTLNTFAQSDTNEGSHSISISIPEVALLDLEGGSSINLAPSAPSEAGNPFDFSTAVDNSIWVNYSSVVASGRTRTVTAAITTGSVPTGMSLKVTAGSYAGSGNGTLGGATSQVTLSNSAQDIITGIGSCYTGNGASNGHNLAYALELDSNNDYDELVQDNTSITVTYTLTDDN
ncbi:MAG: hypothetical protein HQ541_05335 [Mariniphaga sp.]|nr:hypothetical protein [Mariniphaga sp.]